MFETSSNNRIFYNKLFIIIAHKLPLYQELDVFPQQEKGGMYGEIL